LLSSTLELFMELQPCNKINLGPNTYKTIQLQASDKQSKIRQNSQCGDNSIIYVHLELENGDTQHQIGACDLSAGRESKSGAAPVAAAAGVAPRSERASDKRAGGRTESAGGRADR
jgi:hypothetical protein